MRKAHHRERKHFYVVRVLKTMRHDSPYGNVPRQATRQEKIDRYSVINQERTNVCSQTSSK